MSKPGYIDPRVLWGAFTPVPDWLAKQPKVSHGAKLLYSRLARYGAESGEVRPKVETLAAELGISVRQAQYYIAELVAERLIEVERRGSGLSNLYTFPVHHWFSRALGMQDLAPNGIGSVQHVAPDGAKPCTTDPQHVADPSLKKQEKRQDEETTTGGRVKGWERNEEAMMQEFTDRWSLAMGKRAADRLTALQKREAVALWDKAIELQHGEILDESIEIAARDADANHWKYFRRVMENKLTELGRAAGPTFSVNGRDASAARYRALLTRARAGEEINPLALAEAEAWEREQNGEEHRA